MTTKNQIESAIARSQSHNEIVTVKVDDIAIAANEVALIADDSDSIEIDGGLDIWGEVGGAEFRIKLILAAAGHAAA